MEIQKEPDVFQGDIRMINPAGLRQWSVAEPGYTIPLPSVVRREPRGRCADGGQEKEFRDGKGGTKKERRGVMPGIVYPLVMI
jgi:hypothetical protein